MLEVKIPKNFLPRINEDMGLNSKRRPSLQEIQDAVWSCDPSKAAGYDGFNLNFIKRMWTNIGKYISDFILEFFNRGLFPEGINKTWVVLIPKVDRAEVLKDFRPISMVECLYKIIA